MSQNGRTNRSADEGRSTSSDRRGWARRHPIWTTVILLAAWVAAIAVSWALHPPWQVVFGLILGAQLVGAEMLRRHSRDIRREAARQRADRAG